MDFQTIKVSLRQDLGKKATKALRKNNEVPCVLYGGGENIHFYAAENDFRKIIFTPNVYLVNLDLEGKEYKAILKDAQYHPVKDNLLHLDFLQIFDEKAVTIGVPVQLNGLAAGVLAGGKMQLIKRKLTVKALIPNLPSRLDINVDNVVLGGNIKVGELSFDDLELLDPKSDVILTVKLTRAAKGASEEEGGEGTEGTEGTTESAE